MKVMVYTVGENYPAEPCPEVDAVVAELSDLVPSPLLGVLGETTCYGDPVLHLGDAILRHLTKQLTDPRSRRTAARLARAARSGVLTVVPCLDSDEYLAHVKDLLGESAVVVLRGNHANPEVRRRLYELGRAAGYRVVAVKVDDSLGGDGPVPADAELVVGASRCAEELAALVRTPTVAVGSAPGVGEEVRRWQRRK